jgi:hypothetical protein
MSTRSNIGYYMQNGRIRFIYVHWDGYPEGVGAILYDHYRDWAKVKELIDLGDISSLGPEIGEKHDFNAPYDEKYPGTTFYGRDRGDKDVAARVSRDKDSYAKKANDSGAEYAYLFSPPTKKWEVLKIGYGKTGRRWQDLGKVLGRTNKMENDMDLVHGESNPFESITKKDIYQYGTKEEIAFLKEAIDLGVAGAISIPKEPSTDEKIEAQLKRSTFPLINRMHTSIISAQNEFNKIPAEYRKQNIQGKITKVFGAIGKMKKHIEGRA